MQPVPPTPAEDSTIIYGLLRHGETVWNSQKRVQGHGNSPLTENGRKQVAAWAVHLAGGGWQHILCSDLGRVHETVAIINDTLGLPVTIDARLREQHWGEWEGLRIDDVHKNCAEELALQVRRGWDFRPPGGESRKEVCDRAFSALQATQDVLPAKKLLVVCHLGVIKCLVYSVAGRSFLPEEPSLIKKRTMHHIHCHSGLFTLGPLNIFPGVSRS